MSDKYDMIYDGTHLHWTKPDGTKTSYHATSGYTEGEDFWPAGTDYRKPSMQHKKNLGPIPEGTYSMPLALGGDTSLSSYVNGEFTFKKIPGIQNMPPKATVGQGSQQVTFTQFPAWGCHRVPLERIGDNPTGRTDFYLHDSSKGFTHGCVELEHKFFEDLIPFAHAEQLKPDGMKSLVLKVDYSSQRKLGDKATTRGQTFQRVFAPQHIPGNP
jgi:hypothetical protein